MTTRSRLPVLALAAALAGCSTLKVHTQYDPAAPFASYKRYAWLATAPGAEQAAAIRDPGVRSLVVSAIDREMAHKGLVRTTPDADPDFFVSVLGWAQSRIEVTSYGYAYAPAYAYGPSYVGPADVSHYTDGTLLLDFVDARTRQLVWRGEATDTVGSASEVKGSIDEAARRMLEGYPPKP
jgi:hypothetical protein